MNWLIKDKELKRLQEKLSGLPLIPLNKRGRIKRGKISMQLLKRAKEVGEVSNINLMAGVK